MDRLSTFANVGTDVMDLTSVESVLDRADLNYNVITTPLYTMHNGELVEYSTKRATVREDTGDQLGVVSSSYQVCQNRDAFDFVNYIADDIEFVKAGQTASNLIYLIGKLPDVPILGDSVTPYIIFQNSHDGQSSVRATISPLRIVCQNQFNLTFQNSPNTVSIRHSGEIAMKLVEGREILASVADYMRVFRDGAESLVAKKMNKFDMISVFNEVFKYNPNMMSEKQIINFEEKREQFLTCINADDNQNFKNTAWGVLNGFADFATHRPLSSRPNAAESAFVNTSIASRDMTHLYNMLKAI